MVPIRSCASHDYMIPCHPLLVEPNVCTNATYVSSVDGHTTFCKSAEDMDVDNADVRTWETGGPLLRERERYFASMEGMDDVDGDLAR